MATFIKKTVSHLKTVTEDVNKFDTSKRQTADSMCWRKANIREQKRLRQQLNDLVSGLIGAVEGLHKLGFVSLNLRGEY